MGGVVGPIGGLKIVITKILIMIVVDKDIMSTLLILTFFNLLNRFRFDQFTVLVLNLSMTDFEFKQRIISVVLR